MADIFCDKEKMTRERYANTVREVLAESYDILAHSISALPALQDGEEAEHRGLAPEREAAERRKVGLMEPSPCASHSAQKPGEDALLRNFQIPRKNKEQKALFQYLAPESREFEDIVRILNTSYLEPASMGTFAYTKARLVHSELLDKGFCEKRRELKMEGRTDYQLQESYRFLLTDGSKLPDICDKGLHVGHSRVGMLGNPALGVCLSRYSDLLQINPFDVGASGEVIIFKVIKGKVNISKSPLDPTPGFDCHVSKKASSVTSLLSYRAFEITQQYFYEYNFDIIRQVPRHVCPYAVVSFLFKGRQVAPTPPKPAAPLRFISRSSEASAVRSRYTVWRGRLQNRGQLVSEVSLCSSCRAFLPVKLPETLEMDTAMALDQVKQKIPTALLSLNTYGNKSEVMQSRLYCSLFEVEGKEKGTLTGLMMALEREAMVLVKPVIDSGFLLLLSSAQMVHPEGRCGGWVWQLQALFIFQESRGVTRLSAALLEQQARGSEVMGGLQAFLPALQYAEVKLRSCSPANMAAAVGRLACHFLSQPGGEPPLEPLLPAPSRVHSLPRRLQAYLHRPGTYGLPVRHAQRMLRRPARPRSPESQSAAAKAPPGPGPSQDQYDPTMMTKLLNIIKTCKKNRGGPGGQPGAGLGAEPRNGQRIEPGKEEEWPSGCGLKRKCEDESTETPAKHLRRDWESSTGLRAEGLHSPDDPVPPNPAFLNDPSAALRSHGGRTWRSLPQGADGIAEVDVGGASPGGLDRVLEEGLWCFSVEMQDVLRGEGVWYRSEPPGPRPALRRLAFSDYVSQHPSPAFTQHVSELWDGMVCVMGSLSAPPPCTAPPTGRPATSSVGGVRAGQAVCMGTDRPIDRLTAQNAEPLGKSLPVPAPLPAPLPAPSPALLPAPAEVLSIALDAVRHQQDTAWFYIHPGTQPHGHNHCQIKEYLRALGKEECDPQAFLQRPGGTDRLLVVMENQDIATHLHKVPGLVALKRQGVRVSFVGVDGPGDLQNCSYDELLASGGFLVPDEFLLRPDFITHERLQTLLTSLEGRSSSENTWCWKIHCKTRKKLKELGRSSSEALGLVNLLCTYQKRHLVEFLPYHHCDASDHRAPDLPCLIHLQAQNTHYRHTVFLTERRAEMFPGYSDNGIVIANIDDVTNRFEALVGTCGKRAEPQVSTPPPPPAERHPPPPPQRFQPPPPLPEDLHPPLPASRDSHPPPPPPSEFNPPPPPPAEFCPPPPPPSEFNPPPPPPAEFCPPPPPPSEFNPPPPPPAEFCPPPPPPSEFYPPPPPPAEFNPPLPCLEDFWPPLPVLEYGAPSPPAQLVPAPSVPAEPQSADVLLDLDALRLAISQFKASRLEELELGGAATFDPYHSFLSPPPL